MKATIRNGTMFIALPVTIPPMKSRSGKTLVIASSHGNRRTSLKVDKNNVIVNANAYIRPEKKPKTPETARRSRRRKTKE